jgi:hypothetical protein
VAAKQFQSSALQGIMLQLQRLLGLQGWQLSQQQRWVLLA